PPTACSSSAICREVRVVVPSLTVSARSSVMPSASRGSAAVPPRTASTAAIRGNPGRFTTQTTRPFGSLDCAIAGTGSGLSSPKGGRSLGRGFFSAARSAGATSVASASRNAFFMTLLPLRARRARGGRGRLPIHHRAIGGRQVRGGHPLQIGGGHGLELRRDLVQRGRAPAQELGLGEGVGPVDRQL